jgi:hypothetical protein
MDPVTASYPSTAWLASWRAREALARSPRFRAAERLALRRAMVRASGLVAAVLVVGALASTLADPLLGPELLALNVSAAAVSLLLARLVDGRARRQVAGIAYLWGILMAADLLAAGLTSPLQLRNSAMIMPAIPLLYALFMPWTTRAHLIAVGWTTVAALLLTFALQRSGVDPVSPIVLSALVTGAISVAGHALRRADRIDSFPRSPRSGPAPPRLGRQPPSGTRPRAGVDRPPGLLTGAQPPAPTRTSASWTPTET